MWAAWLRRLLRAIVAMVERWWVGAQHAWVERSRLAWLVLDTRSCAVLTVSDPRKEFCSSFGPRWACIGALAHWKRRTTMAQLTCGYRAVPCGYHGNTVLAVNLRGSIVGAEKVSSIACPAILLQLSFNW